MQKDGLLLKPPYKMSSNTKFDGQMFVLTKAISTKGVQISSKGQIITLQIGKNEIFFDSIFQHGSGQLFKPFGHQHVTHYVWTS
jgi:hypothetical protein